MSNESDKELISNSDTNSHVSTDTEVNKPNNNNINTKLKSSTFIDTKSNDQKTNSEDDSSINTR